MNKLFYPKLAASNIRKNGRTYIPYILTSAFTVAMFYIIRSLSLNAGIDTMLGADTITYTLSLGSWIVGIFAVIFLFYTNSFLMKRRKKEFGLFNILGMEKKHLAKVIGLETLYIAVISLAAGLLLGVALDKLMYMVILKWLGGQVSLGFYISWPAMLTVLALFAAIFLLIFLNSLRQIHLAKPIELLQGGNMGEKEPKTKWIMALLGAACLGVGYYLAVVTKNPVSAVMVFFIAVLLVILGTYMLFTAGSIALLKILRKKKKYYYNPKHFTSVSGLIYRMKQNAVGLANICILSTMVLVMIASTSSMMIGMEEIIQTRYPYDMTFYLRASDTSAADPALQADMTDRVGAVLDRHGVKRTEEMSYTYLSIAAVREGSAFRTDLNADVSMLDSVNNLFFVALSDYNRITGENRTLEDGQAMLYSNREAYHNDTLSVFDRQYKIVQKLDDFLGNGVMAADIASSHFLVVKDMAEVEHIFFQQMEAYEGRYSEIQFCYSLDLDADADTQQAVYDEVITAFVDQPYSVTIDSKVDSRESFMGLYGGLFFLGAFLGVLFIMATILIIYYKQVSEGYDDKERFAIMQKVGMSHAEVKRSIHSQILTVFFLPLVTAGVHVAFAFPVISKILAMFSLTNTALFIACTVGCFLIFALLYAVIFGLTAKAYYRIVSR